VTDDPSLPPQDPHPSLQGRCGRRTKRGTCKAWPVRGATVCVAHGGAAPQVKRAAGRRLAIAEFGRAFGEIAPEADPHDVILTEIRWSAGHVAWLREKVAGTAEDALAASAWLPLYERERDRLVRQADIAIRAGVETRMVELAERTGALIGDLIGRVLGELDLTPEQQATAAAALPRHLRLLAGQLNGGAS
jgi:hypothetical protein